jgi:hypothetical protein
MTVFHNFFSTDTGQKSTQRLLNIHEPAKMSSGSGTTVIDERYERYRQLQSDIQQLFLSKQQYLSQFNENTLVKGVRCSASPSIFTLDLWHAHRSLIC